MRNPVLSQAESQLANPMPLKSIGQGKKPYNFREIEAQQEKMEEKRLSVLDLARFLGVKVNSDGLEDMNLMAFKTKLEEKSKTLDEKIQEATVLTKRAESEGLEVGIQMGKEKGYEEGAAEVQSHAQALSEALTKLQGELDFLKKNLTESVTALVSASVSKILGDVVDEGYVLKLVQKELGTLVDPGFQLVVHCNLKTRTLIEKNIGRIVPRNVLNSNSEPIVFLEDESIAFGGFLVTYPKGRIDCRIELRIEEVMGKLGASNED